MEEAHDIARIWFDALVGSSDLDAFCTERFGAGVNVLLGVPTEDKAGQDQAPYVAVVPLKDDGGYEVEQAESTIVLDLGIVDKQRIKVGANGLILRGHESLGLFVAAARNILAETDFPPSSWEIEAAPPMSHFFEAICFFKVDQDRTIGAD